MHYNRRAWLDEAVPQCGYCQAGQIMSTVALLRKHSNPTHEQIDAALAGNLCRCGTAAAYSRGGCACRGGWAMKRRTFLAAGATLTVSFCAGCSMLPALPRRPVPRARGRCRLDPVSRGQVPALSAACGDGAERFDDAQADRLRESASTGMIFGSNCLRPNDIERVRRWVVNRSKTSDTWRRRAQPCRARSWRQGDRSATDRSRDSRERTAYVRGLETESVSSAQRQCSRTGRCHRTWPPALCERHPTARHGVRPGVARPGIARTRVAPACLERIGSQACRWLHRHRRRSTARTRAQPGPGNCRVHTGRARSRLCGTRRSLGHRGRLRSIERRRGDRHRSSAWPAARWRTTCMMIRWMRSTSGTWTFASIFRWQPTFRWNRGSRLRTSSANALQLWAGSQDTFFVRDVLARHLGLSAQDVSVQAMRVGGAFGGKTICLIELGRSGTRRRATGEGAMDVRRNLQARFPPWLQNLADFVGDMGVARGAVCHISCSPRAARDPQRMKPSGAMQVRRNRCTAAASSEGERAAPEAALGRGRPRGAGRSEATTVGSCFILGPTAARRGFDPGPPADPDRPLAWPGCRAESSGRESAIDECAIGCRRIRCSSGCARRTPA
ncbi:MAG: 2Fe-2S iron-sulfur cluster-binding protein [Burkholderiaceae bacterium]